MTFYLGRWLIQQDVIDPKHDADSWALPDDTAQHMADTSNVEELLIAPELMDVLPQQIQFGLAEYSVDEGWLPDHEAYNQFYPKDEAFYLRSFTPVDYWTPQWYPGGSEFYTGLVVNFPSMWQTSWYPSGNFYVREFTGTDHFTNSFYTSEPSWYVRSFTPTGSLWNFYTHETGYD